MKIILLYVYNICWPHTDDTAFYNTRKLKTSEYIEMPKDVFFEKKQRDEYIDFVLNRINGIKPLRHEYSIDYVCQFSV
jgi:hypothetical protein